MKSDLRKIRQLLEKNRTGEALDKIKDASFYQDIEKEATVLSARHKQNTSQYHTGTINHQDYLVEKSRIQFAILHLIESVNPKGISSFRGRNDGKLRTLLIVLLVLLIVSLTTVFI